MEGAGSLPQSATFDTLKDCVAYQIIQTSKEQQSGIRARAKANRRGKHVENLDEDIAAELDEFVLYLTQEIYDTLPSSFKQSSITDDSTLEQLPDSLAVPATFTDTLTTYSLSDSPDNAADLFHSIVSAFISEWKVQATTNIVDESAPPPSGWKSTRTEECEICNRVVPLTYHHLIPRSTHQKVLKRKWHPESRLNAVAWLCRPCHSAVHKSASNEDLAREYYTVELLMQTESIQRWAAYASRQRWGVRRG